MKYAVTPNTDFLAGELILIDKFLDWTSFDVVNKIRYQLKFKRNIPDQELIDDLIRVAKELGQNKVTTFQYNDSGHYSNRTFIRRFGSWLKALEQAGLQKTKNSKASNGQLFENFIEVWTKLGSQPKPKDFTKGISKYSVSTYKNRFGGWRKTLEAFFAWVNEEDMVKLI